MEKTFKPQTPFDMEGYSPIEITQKICATILELTADAYEKGYKTGHKDGMTEAVTTITE